ncbi:AraC family transcriptional regulator [Catenuloplanes japonicus]|uniref:AraC family transcriptional regulator n=1 Tax=Catenuloplanes japonicus TaxID=33876 RepID=UPI00068AA2AA|nr:AraC family transcriptional regulator [Catenuloplanes japonicus]
MPTSLRAPTGADFTRIEAHGAWSMSFALPAGPRISMVTEGSAVLTSRALGLEMTLGPGDCFILQKGVDFTVSSDRQGRTGPTVRPRPDDDWPAALRFGASSGPATTILCANLGFSGAGAEEVTGELPPVLPLPLEPGAARTIRATFDLLADESPDSPLIGNRLMDVLFVKVFRALMAGTPGGVVRLFRNPALARAAYVVHRDPGRAWTVEMLAREAQMSRSTFATAFRDAVGESPGQYLIRWRLHHARHLLAETSLSLAEVADRVGYESAAALSKSFRRRYGLAPGAWRQRSSPDQVVERFAHG